MGSHRLMTQLVGPPCLPVSGMPGQQECSLTNVASQLLSSAPTVSHWSIDVLRFIFWFYMRS